MSYENISTFTRKAHVKAIMSHCSLQLRLSSVLTLVLFLNRVSSGSSGVLYQMGQGVLRGTRLAEWKTTRNIFKEGKSEEQPFI